MSQLRELQRAVQRSVLHRDPAPALEVVVDAQGAPARSRLDVYIHGYGARLSEVLRNDFHGLFAMIGEPAFDALVVAYVDSHPSRNFNVRWYGAHLSEFLRSDRPWSDTPALSEMAALDWAIGLCFDAADEPCVDANSLQAIAPNEWPGLRLRLRHCVQRLRVNWNVGDIRRALDNGDVVPERAPLLAERGWVVSRVGVKIFHRELPDDEAAALDLIVEGRTFSEVCQELARRHEADAVAMRAVLLMRGWVDNGWIAGMST